MDRTRRLRRLMAALVLSVGFVATGMPQALATAAPPPVVKDKGVADGCAASVRHVPRTPAGFGHAAGDADTPRRCKVRPPAQQFPRTSPHFQHRAWVTGRRCHR
jgi:hypothetical protein